MNLERDMKAYFRSVFVPFIVPLVESMPTPAVLWGAGGDVGWPGLLACTFLRSTQHTSTKRARAPFSSELG